VSAIVIFFQSFQSCSVSQVIVYLFCPMIFFTCFYCTALFCLSIVVWLSAIKKIFAFFKRQRTGLYFSTRHETCYRVGKKLPAILNSGTDDLLFCFVLMEMYQLHFPFQTKCTTPFVLQKRDVPTLMNLFFRDSGDGWQ
jgi:hypothetical protein